MMKGILPFFMRLGSGAALATVVVSGASAQTVDSKALKPNLVLAASFDSRLDADYAAGDGTLFTALQGSKRSDRVAGLPPEGLVRHAKGEGRFGDALFFTKKMKPVVFFSGDKNIAFKPEGWSGTCSFWLKLDPDKDLEPGYCDPLQLVGQAWDNGHMFVEFSKDHSPRHFRFAMRPVKALWNPANVKWEESPEKPNLMVESLAPPFNSKRWTHVAFTFEGVNSKGLQAVGKLYLGGKAVGTFRREQIFDWDPSQTALTLGLSYIGGLDDLAFFNRALSESEVKGLFDSNQSVAEIAK